MFKAISWSQYVGVVLVLLLLYYAYVALVYYRAELLGLARGKGRGNAVGATPAPKPALASLIGGKGPLIAKSAVTLPALPPEVAGPTTGPTVDEQPTEPAETDEEATSQEHEQESAEDLSTVEELPALDLPTVEVEENIYDVNTIFLLPHDAKSINFIEPDATTAFLATESAFEEYEPDFTIGIAQLGDFLERATEGQISPRDIVEQEPGLANTDLLVSFFQSSSQSIQRATSHIYTGLAETELD